MLSSAVRLRSLVAFLIAVLLTAGSWGETSTHASASPPYLVLIVMDGFRPDYATLAPMHHLRQLIARGRSYDSAWVGQLESETPAGHATIATGVYPRKHGVIGFGWRDPVSGGFTYMPTNVGQIKAGALWHVIEQGGVPTISDLIHSRTRHDAVISVSGEKLWASAPMGTGADYVLYGWDVKVNGKDRFRPVSVGPNVPAASTHYTSVTAPNGAFAYQDGFAARLAVRLVDSLRPRALLLNLPAADIAGHYFGGIGRPRDMAPIIRGDDAAIGLVIAEYKRLGLLNKTIFLVTADHGMVTGRRRVPIHSIYKAVAHAGVQQLDQELQNSMGSIWLRDPQDAGSLAVKLAADHFNGVEGALYKVPDGTGWKFQAEPSLAAKFSPPLLRAYLDLADTEASINGADLLLPYMEDTTGLAATKAFRGMHGGFSWGSQHIPLIIAGPGVRPGVSHFPAKLVDVAPTLERLLGLHVPTGVDGVVLADAVKSATTAERAAQQAIAGSRAADIRALQAHSAAQLKHLK